MKITFPNIQPFLDQFHSLSSKMDPKILAALSAVTVLIFSRLAYLRSTPSTNSETTLVRKPSLSRVPTLLRNGRHSYVLSDIRARTNTFITEVLKTPPELPSGKIKETIVWIKDSLDSIYLQVYCFIFKNTIATDRENIQNLMLKVGNLKEVIQICKKHSDVLLDFAIFQSLFSERVPRSEESEKELNKLTTLWERKGFAISLKDNLDDSFRPLLRNYRDCLLFFAPYLHPFQVEKQALLLIKTVEKSLFKNNPEQAARFLSSLLLSLYPKGLPSTDPIIKALEDLSADVDLRDLLYKSTIFPLIGRTFTGIVYPETAKVRETVYRQIVNNNCSAKSLNWLVNVDLCSLDNDPTLGPLRQLVKETIEPLQNQVLHALFHQNPDAIEEFLNQQMLATFNQKPSLIKQLLPSLSSWNGKKPLRVKSHIFYAYYIRTKEQFLLSFAASTHEGSAFISKVMAINTDDLKKDFTNDFETNHGLEVYLLKRALQDVTADEIILREALEGRIAVLEDHRNN